ncbi:MAG: hypothetical protein ACOWWM_02250 [Desulfobacterales bacterium]
MKRTLMALTLLALLPVGCAVMPTAEDSGALRHRIADAYGISEFDRIETIRFTFNVDLPDRRVSRAWIWHPAEDRVTRIEENQVEGLSYDREQLRSQPSDELVSIDSQFINDRYWLLFPFQIEWDRQAAVEDQGMEAAPISGRSLRRVVVTYPPDGGYTPGDVYEIFVDERFRIVEWIYRKGGSVEPTRQTTWEDHRRVGPILLSLDHHGPDKQFRVRFTDVAVRLKGDSRWMAAGH